MNPVVCLFSLSVFAAASLSAAEPAKPAAAKVDSKPAAKAESAVGRHVLDFVLPDADGKPVGLGDFKDAKLLVVAVIGRECPVANAQLPTLIDLDKTYRDKAVRVVGVLAGPGDSPELARKHAKDYSVSFPVLIDAQQSVVSLLGATRTPEVFVLDGRRIVRYQGRIDDRMAPGVKRDEARRHDLREAIDELLAGKAVSTAHAEAAGCRITKVKLRKSDSPVTWAKDVQPIVSKFCAECHRPGTAAPFALLSAKDAADHAAMIREVVSQRSMPPWHADPRFGKFANERRLSPEEVETLSEWIDAGAPIGTVPAETKTVKAEPAAWRIGKPDVVFKIPAEFTVPAKGKVSYQYFTTKTDFKEDMWIQAAEARPGNPDVVHHIIVFYKEKGIGKQPVWLTAIAPGADATVFPEGLGRKIPAGAELIWQMHYTVTGKVEKDRSELGLVFCKTPPKKNVNNFGIQNVALKIPPGASDHEVTARIPVIRDAVLMSLFPHMHVRGKSFEYVAVLPNGKREVLLSVPQYDFNWQHTYRLKEPMRLPRGTQIICTARYDNSAANPANPDPTKTVRWGDQTWDEMMIGYLDFYWDDGKP